MEGMPATHHLQRHLYLAPFEKLCKALLNMCGLLEVHEGLGRQMNLMVVDLVNA